MNVQVSGLLTLHEVLKYTFLNLAILVPIPDEYGRLEPCGSLDLLFCVVLHRAREFSVIELWMGFVGLAALTPNAS